MTAPVVAIMDALLTHAQAAAGALTDPITDVAIGLPMPRGRCVRVYWSGEVAPPHFSGTLTLVSQLVGQTVEVTAYWPFADADEAAAADRLADMAGFTHEMRTRVLGDADLGGASTDLVMEDAIPQLQQIAGTWYAFVPCVFRTGATEYVVAL